MNDKHDRFPRRLAALLFGLAAVATPAAAQTDACERYRTELAAIEAGGGRDYMALADQQAVELERMRRYYQSLSCGVGQSRFLVFGAPQTPECAEAEVRLDAMEENYQRLLTEASRSGGERRNALLAAIEQYCTPQAERPGLFDTLFNRPDQQPAPFIDGPGFSEEEQAVSPGEPICVRTCDGFFFPLPGGARDLRDAANLCQAQCPSSPTAVFYKPQGAPIEQSVSVDGQPYMSLQNALRYRQAFDETCGCRQVGQSWSEALAPAEGLIGSGDEVVDQERARELSRPRGEAADVRRPPVATSADIPFFGLDEGEWRDTTTADGSRRVRVVAPEVIPAPDTAAPDAL